MSMGRLLRYLEQHPALGRLFGSRDDPISKSAWRRLPAAYDLATRRSWTLRVGAEREVRILGYDSGVRGIFSICRKWWRQLELEEPIGTGRWPVFEWIPRAATGGDGQSCMIGTMTARLIFKIAACDGSGKQAVRLRCTAAGQRTRRYDSARHGVLGVLGARRSEEEYRWLLESVVHVTRVIPTPASIKYFEVCAS